MDSFGLEKINYDGLIKPWMIYDCNSSELKPKCLLVFIDGARTKKYGSLKGKEKYKSNKTDATSRLNFLTHKKLKST